MKKKLKKCEGMGCDKWFWPYDSEKQRRCWICHRLKRPYKDGSINTNVKLQRKRHEEARNMRMYGSKNRNEPEWEQVLRKKSKVCPMCGHVGNMTLDHIKPLSQGGLHMPSNIQMICDNCHKIKDGNTENKTLKKIRDYEKQILSGVHESPDKGGLNHNC